MKTIDRYRAPSGEPPWLLVAFLSLASLGVLGLVACSSRTPAEPSEPWPLIWPVDYQRPHAKTASTEEYWRNELARANRRVAVTERLLNVALDDRQWVTLQLREIESLK